MDNRERDERGRFVKRQPSTNKNNENDFHHEILRTYNRIADGGHEYSIEDARKREVWMAYSLKVLWILLIVFIAWLFCGCATRKPIEYVTVEKRVIETKTIKDTIHLIQLIPYKDSIATHDSTSHLENQYAYSDAAMHNGILTHTLGIFSQRPIEVLSKEIIITITDSIPYPVPGPTEYIERELTWFEKTLMGLGALAVGVLFGYITFMFKR